MMDPEKPVRIVVAADRALVRRGMADYARRVKGMQVVGEAQDEIETLQLCDLVSPEVVLMDLHLPAERCETLITRIQEQQPGTRIALLINLQEECDLRCQQLSNVFFLSKDINETDFLAALAEIGSQLQPIIRLDASASLRLDHLSLLGGALQGDYLDPEALGTLLSRHIPVIFPESQVNIRLFPNQELVSHPVKGASPLVDAAFRWLRTTHTPQHFEANTPYPWGGQQQPDTRLILMPILKGRQAIGGISLMDAVTRAGPQDLTHTLETLSSQIAQAVDVSQNTWGIASEDQLSRELLTAGRIQADILPEKPPVIEGWEIAARLVPARETSGDFYDFIPLAGRNYGIVVADVTDKGMGAALFMALASTLFRTFTGRYPSLPALTMDAVNDRILSDTRGNMFITSFLGILEPHTGRIRFVNAGHPPGILLSGQRGRPPDRLRPTGMALGVMEKVHWQQKMVRMLPGDTLVLYTDGITDAQNAQGHYFGDQRLGEVLRAAAALAAEEFLEQLLREFHQFTGEGQKLDDIAVVVVKRKV